MVGPEFRRGTLYLGGTAPPADDPAAELLEYDSRDLVTHGVIVGMTGSGKTGLALGILEEAVLSGIPVLAIDPKGDVTNLLLHFPDLSPDDFLPWINEGDAARKGQTPEAFAAETAERWKAGLASWGIGQDRVRQLRDSADFTIVTPGSSAGLPLNVLGSLRAPSLSWDTETETLRDEIEGFASSLLGMADLPSDPIASREHVLISNLVEYAWRQGRSLDLTTLIQQILEPPMRKLGVFDVDEFFPAKDRTELALRLNGLIASPSFASWLEGPPLDVPSLLEPSANPFGSGKPRATVVYLAHLSDGERQFVVTLLLSKVATWMHTLSGTTDLRALVYFDEVFGFVPPTESPPAKKPILTLLKTARAFGVGLLLGTQNPVDLDYKAMSNAGTWFVGRLQTERDKARIVEALSSASGAVDVRSLDAAIGGLEQRRFLLHDTHDPPPRVFTTRWAMSYLRGPLTREQISSLMAEPRHSSIAPAEAATVAAPEVAPAPALGAEETPVAPETAPGVPTYVLDPAAAWAAKVGAVTGGSRLQAALIARVHLRFDDAKAGVDHTEQWEAVWVPLPERFDPAGGLVVDLDPRDLRSEAPPGATFELPATSLADARRFKEVATTLRQHLARARTVTVLRNRSLKLYSRVGETPEEFAGRCDAAALAEADREAAKIRDRLEASLATARRRAEEAEVDLKTRKQQETISGTGSVIGILLGGRGNTRDIARRAGSAIGSASTRRGMTARAQERLETARGKMAEQERDLDELEREITEEIAEIDARSKEQERDVEELEIGLESSDVDIDEVAVLWIPVA
ncbi:MAG TPA: hypothetical protein VF382_04300 [Actinomycetota bacterium]